MILKRAGIIGTGSYVPEQIITNADLEKLVDTSDEWIKTRTGIEERRITDKNTACSDIATIAAKRAIETANIPPRDIDLIIVATVTPDMNFPATACLIQNNIGADKSAAFDLEAGCTGFIYAFAVATQFIMTGASKNALVIGADVLSKITDWSDRNTCVLFGDGAGAVILSNVEGDGVLSNYLRADGSGGDLLYMPGGGSRNPATSETVKQKLHYIKMNGNEVFKFAVRAMNDAAEAVLKEAGLSVNEIDLMIPHQANKRIVDAAAKRLDITPEKIYVNLNRYGNMSGASIPVALDEAVKEGKIKKGDYILMVGFGAGLTWGASLVKWNY